MSQATGRARTLVGFAAFGTFWGSWGAELPDVKSHANAGDAALGIALFCIGAGALVAMRPAGVLVDRGGRKVLPAITAAFAVCGFLPALATSPVGLGAVVVLLGASSGSLDVAINAEGVRSEAAGRPVLRLAHGLFSAGAVSASVLTGGLRAAGAQPAAVLGAISGLVLLAAAIALALDPAPPHHEDTPRLRELLRAPRALVALGALCALAFFVEGSWQSWGAVQLQSTLNASAAVSAAAPALFAAAMACGRIGGQNLRGPEWVLLALAAALAAAGTLVGATATTAVLALLGIMIAGLGISICAPTLIAMAGRGTTPERRGSAVSVVTTVAYLGFLLGPAAVGVVANATSLRAAFAGVAVVALLLSALAAGRARAGVGALLARGDRG